MKLCFPPPHVNPLHHQVTNGVLPSANHINVSHIFPTTILKSRCSPRTEYQAVKVSPGDSLHMVEPLAVAANYV